jgi:hypothetical protein
LAFLQIEFSAAGVQNPGQLDLAARGTTRKNRNAMLMTSCDNGSGLNQDATNRPAAPAARVAA